jgi:hypothetical protein
VENIPVLLGALIALVGAAVLWDALGPQTLGPMRERRRRTRQSIDVAGELLAGVGILLLGAALIGRDWRFETPTVLLGTVCVVLGAFRNRKYFAEAFLFRGRARRDDEGIQKKPGKMRIR